MQAGSTRPDSAVGVTSYVFILLGNCSLLLPLVHAGPPAASQSRGSISSCRRGGLFCRKSEIVLFIVYRPRVNKGQHHPQIHLLLSNSVACVLLPAVGLLRCPVMVKVVNCLLLASPLLFVTEFAEVCIVSCLRWQSVQPWQM